MIAIQAKGLSKGYRQYQNNLEPLKAFLLRRPLAKHQLMVLENIDFTLTAGETLGVIGDNGAGKSTLLKLLAQTITPTSGELTIQGRVSAILELGSGFHPEFSGYENIKIGCAMMGMNVVETKRASQAIIDFSELSPDVLARPIKTYSSGMYVRLAFSIVTAVSPDILVIDEALSVGDLHFQKKSLDKIKSFIKKGKSVVFCSHNLFQVKSLCQKALWLKDGQICLAGEADEVVDAYIDYARQSKQETVSDETFKKNAIQNKTAYIVSTELVDCPKNSLQQGDTLTLKTCILANQSDPKSLSLGVVLMRNDDIHVFGSSTNIAELVLDTDKEGMLTVILKFPKLPLFSGQYLFYLYLTDLSEIHIYDKREAVLPFAVRHKGKQVGMVCLEHEWII